MRIFIGFFCVVLSLVFISAPVFGEDNESKSEKNWFDLNPTRLFADDSDTTAEAPADTAKKADPAPAAAPPPIPILNIQGTAGGAITPLAYFCNAGKKGSLGGLPTVAYSFVNIGSKELHSVAVTQTFFQRLELGFAWNNFNVGSLYGEVRDLGLDMGPEQINLYHFNIRGLLIEENSFDMPLPALTAGVHIKHNTGVDKIDKRLGGALTGIGLDRATGVDLTLTATKMFPTLAFGRPLILTGGMRLTRAYQIGLLGFGDQYEAFFEGSVAVMPTDNLLFAYEFRMKESPYDKFLNLIGEEDNWHAFSLTWIVNEHFTLTGIYGNFGHVLNAHDDCVVGLQARWEF